jgi:hypothetical protein
MEKQQTTLEWLKEQFEKDGDTTFLNLNWDRFDELLQQAKEMEKEQIIDAYENGVKETNSRCEYQDAEQYYNETFKSE